MSTQKRLNRCATRARTTIPILGTTAAPEVKLDHASRLALDYSRAILKARMKVDPLASGVARRALQLYAHRLSDPSIDPAEEAREVRRVCSALTASEEAQEGAYKRLQEVTEDNPLPGFWEVLHGPEMRREIEALNHRVEELATHLST